MYERERAYEEELYLILVRKEITLRMPTIPFTKHCVFAAYGIRDANAYILVFDLLCPDSFEYVSGMFAQINDSRDLGRVPVVVVGNKTDKVNDNIYKSRFKARRDSEERKDMWDHDGHHGGHGGHGFGGHGDEYGHGGHGFGGHGHDHHGFGHFGGGGFGGHHHGDYFGSSKKKHKDKKDRHKRGGDYGHDDHHHGKNKWDRKNKHKSYEINWANTYTPDEFLEQDIAEKVTSEWKVMYKECSAKDPEAVTDLFKSVMGVFEEVGVHRFEEDERGHDYDRPKPCTIL